VRPTGSALRELERRAECLCRERGCCHALPIYGIERARGITGHDEALRQLH
jgi:hypothetical protein